MDKDNISDAMATMWKEMSDSILNTINTQFDRFEENFLSLQSSQKDLSNRMDLVDEAVTDHGSRIAALEASTTNIK